MYADPARGRGSILSRSRTSGKVLTALAVFALLTVGCLILMNDSDYSDADTVTIDGITYSSVDTTAHVTGYVGSSPSITIPSSVNIATTDRTVTTIDPNAFKQCTTITSVIIPDSVTYIGAYAFMNCTSLVSVTIPDSVTYISDYAFYGCTKLASITIPDSVTFIGLGTFRGCISLPSITVDVSNTNYSSEDGVLFDKSKTELIQYPAGKSDPSYTIPDSVTTIDNTAFDQCSSLASVTIPDSVTSIGSAAFNQCSSLASITIPDSVTTVGPSTFWGCTSLTSVTIPDSLTTIEYGTFNGCTKLTTVTIPDSVTSIGTYAFNGCTKLTTVTIPDSVTTIGTYAFNGCTKLTTVTIPDSVTAIGNYAFEGCASLTSVTIPDSVTSFGSGVFNGCTALTSVTIPDSVTSIGSYAFMNCTSLASVTIPDSVTTIGNNAFYGCTALTSVTIPDSVTSFGSSVFNGCTSLTSITVGASNTEYSSENGVLFNKSKTQLIQYPAAKTDPSYTIPNSVTTIDSTAFLSAENLRSIDIGQSNPNYSSANGLLYNKTGEDLIACPAGIESVILPDTVKNVSAYALSGGILKDVTFSSGSDLQVETYGLYECTSIEMITIEDSAKVMFDANAISDRVSEKHTIRVSAPEGFEIPKSALLGNIELVYGSSPDPGDDDPKDDDPKGNDSDDKPGFPIAVAVGGGLAVLALAGAAFFLIRRH